MGQIILVNTNTNTSVATSSNNSNSNLASMNGVSVPNNPGGKTNVAAPGNGNTAVTISCLMHQSNNNVNTTVRLPAGTTFILSNGGFKSYWNIYYDK